MTKIYIEDAREAGFCNHGLRDFAERHNLDYFDFLNNGIDVERLLHLNDANVQRAYQIALRREASNGKS